MSFNGVVPYDNFLPTASQSEILLNAFYLRLPDYNGDIIMIRNGSASYALLYNLELVSNGRYTFDYIQYFNRGGAGSHYEFEFGQSNFLTTQLNNSYIYQSNNLLYGGNVIQSSGYVDHVNLIQSQHYSFISSVLIGTVLLFSFFVQFFKKIIF